MHLIIFFAVTLVKSFEAFSTPKLLPRALNHLLRMIVEPTGKYHQRFGGDLTPLRHYSLSENMTAHAYKFGGK